MKGILCKIRGHNYSPQSTGNILIKEYECTSCNEKFTTDGYGKIVKLNRYWKENNILFEKYFQEYTL